MVVLEDVDEVEEVLEVDELVVEDGRVVEVELDEVDELLVEVDASVDPPGSLGAGNGQEERPLVATAMYLRQMVAGNDPPVTAIPWTFRMNVPSG